MNLCSSLLCCLSLCLLIFIFSVRTNYIDIQPNVLPADRICKPGPPLKRSTGKVNCLVIGDSISIGYTPWVAKILGDNYQVQHAPWDHRDGGALDSKYGIRCLPLFLSTDMLEPTSYDVIIFNFGLHDVNYAGEWIEEYTPPIEYSKNLREIKSLLLSSGANVGFVLTTPVPFNVTINDLVKEYNTIATNVMKEQPVVATADLYYWVVKVCGEPPYSECKIAAKQPNPHYTPQGYEYLSEMVKALVLNLSRGSDEKSRLKVELLKTEQDTKLAASYDTVPCKGESGDVVTVCPSNSTCCESLYSASGQGCCLLPQAASCKDGKHCCPPGYECDPDCSIYQCNCLVRL